MILFLYFKISVSQAITFPRSKKSEWNRDNMPIAHPYVTSTVYLNSNPLTKYNNHEIIKSKSDKVYCSYNRKKYDHNFYLYYDNEGTRWSKTINSIKKGNIRVHISGFYIGSNENNNSLFHAIQLTELDFESKFNKTMDNDDNNEFFFGNSFSKNQLSKFSSNKSKKHQISSLSKTEYSDKSTSSNTSTKNKKKHKKNTKKSSFKAESTFDESTTLTRSLSYNDLPLTKMNQQLNKDDNFSQDSDSQNVHELSEKYNSHIIADKKKGKKSVKFTTNEQIEEDDSMKSLSNNKKRSNKNIHNKKGIKDQTTHSIKSASSRVLRSNQKKKGIMDIAVDKIVEVSDEDTIQDNKAEKSESFSMDIDDDLY